MELGDEKVVGVVEGGGEVVEPEQLVGVGVGEGGEVVKVVEPEQLVEVEEEGGGEVVGVVGEEGGGEVVEVEEVEAVEAVENGSLSASRIVRDKKPTRHSSLRRSSSCRGRTGRL